MADDASPFSAPSSSRGSSTAALLVEVRPSRACRPAAWVDAFAAGLGEHGSRRRPRLVERAGWFRRPLAQRVEAIRRLSSPSTKALSSWQSGMLWKVIGPDLCRML